MNIRKARQEDVAQVAEIFRRCTDFMIQQGIRQWNYTYPLVSHVALDVQNESAFLMESEDQIVAAITLDHTQDSQYKDIHWHINDRLPLVIHRLAVMPEFQGRGIAGTLCRFAEAVAKERSCRSIRLDAYSLNPSSNHLYVRLGYKRASGVCYFHNNPVPFYCYDKIME